MPPRERASTTITSVDTILIIDAKLQGTVTTNNRAGPDVFCVVDSAGDLLSRSVCSHLGVLQLTGEVNEDVFFVTSVLREMSGGEMKLELTDDTVTFAITTARSTPLCWREKDQRQIDGLQEKVNHPTEWCHTLVPVPKRSTDGSVTGCRLTVDLTKLDKCVNTSCSRDSRRRCIHRAP